MHGTVPFVDAARIWALAAGLHETNTAERLLRLGESGRLPDEDVRAWVPSFEYFQLMRLRAQHQRAQSYAGAADNPNEVALGDLSALDRRIINEAFRQARKVQQRLELDFPG
jgi:CBS domain-containing protein